MRGNDSRKRCKMIILLAVFLFQAYCSGDTWIAITKMCSLMLLVGFIVLLCIKQF